MRSFIFDSYEANSEKRELVFNYSIVSVEEKLHFTEKIILPEVPSSDIPPELLDRLLHSLHLMLGISYWKLYCPKEIVINTKPLTKEQAVFWNTVYTKGLGEFYYKNNIDFRNLISFPFEESEKHNPISYPRKDRSLVGIGGGKDSIVTAELLKKYSKEFSTFLVETQRPHSISSEISSLLGKNLLKIERKIDPKLFELNSHSDTYNGHIPISAIFAFLSILSAVLYDHSYVIVSNERSANYGNMEYLGETINHQWSKTIEFEELFQQYVKSFITSDVTYFSLLRQLSEYSITQLFSQYPQYFHAFTSCNRNFIINKEVSSTRWCGECPKCAFVFIMLASFLPKSEIIGIFGNNLLNTASLVPTYKELLGTEGFKPFECVGTPEEVKLAFYNVLKKGEFNESAIMKYFENEVLPTISDSEMLEKEVVAKGRNLIPDEFKHIIKN